MKRLLSTLLVCAAAITGLQAQSVDDLGKIKFTGVKSMRIESKGAERYAYFQLEVSNGSSNDLTIADSRYSITFFVEKKIATKGDDEKKPVEWEQLPTLHNAHPTKEVRLPKGSMMSDGKGVIEIVASLGERNEETTENVMIPLFNIAAGAEQRRVRIVLDGDLRYGVSAGNATAFQDRKIRWELETKTIEHLVFEK